MDDDILAAWHNAMAAMGAVPVTVDYDIRGPSGLGFRPVHVVSSTFTSNGVEIAVVTTVWTPATPDGHYEAVAQIAWHGRVRTSRESWSHCTAAVTRVLRNAFINATLCLRCAHLLEQHTIIVDNAVRCHCGCRSFKS